MMKIITIFLSLLLFVVLDGACQEVNNIIVSQDGDKILVQYDLAGNGQVFFITLYYSVDDGKTWLGPLQKVTGDVWTVKTSGTNKKIIWNAKEEQGTITGHLQFKINLDLLGSDYFKSNQTKQNNKIVTVKKDIVNFQNELSETSHKINLINKYKKRKTIWLFSSIASVGVGGFTYSKSEIFIRQIWVHNRNNTYNSPEAVDLTKKYNINKNIGIAAFGVATLCFIELIIQSKKYKKAKSNLEIEPFTLKNSHGIKVAYNF